MHDTEVAASNAAAQEPHPLMTIAEVSEMTRTKEATLRFWRSVEPSRGPRMFKLGGKLMAKREDVEAWIQAAYDAEADR